MFEDKAMSSLEYCIIQFSARPDRHEFINVAVLVLDKSSQVYSHLQLESFERKVFAEFSTGFLKAGIDDFASRIADDFRSGQLKPSSLNKKSAGVFRVTELYPVMNLSIHEALEELFNEFVAPNFDATRGPRPSTMLSSALSSEGVLELVESRPAPVHLDTLDYEFQADFGFQNGVMNLIKSARFDDSERALREAGRTLIQGRALEQVAGNRLIVVGEFGDLSDKFVSGIRDEFKNSPAKLFAMNEVAELADEIRVATAH